MLCAPVMTYSLWNRGVRLCMGKIGWRGRRPRPKGRSGASNQRLPRALSKLEWMPVPTPITCFSHVPLRDELSSPSASLLMLIDGCQCSGKVSV